MSDPSAFRWRNSSHLTTSCRWPTDRLIFMCDVIRSMVTHLALFIHSLAARAARCVMMNIYESVARPDSRPLCWVVMRRIEHRLCAAHVPLPLYTVFFLSLSLFHCLLRPPVLSLKPRSHNTIPAGQQRLSRRPIAATPIALCTHNVN